MVDAPLWQDPMIDLYYAPTPNGWKISIMLEELGIPYRIIPVDIRAGDQFKPEFLAISPNNRIPAIVDHAPPDGGGPFSVFETGAILIYLADKAGRFIPNEMRARSVVIQWLMWQMSALGPMLGQHGHFALYAPERIPYAIERYRDEAARLYHVLDRQLGKTGAYVAGNDYTIADIACFPWTMTHKAQGLRSTTILTSSAGMRSCGRGRNCRRGLRSASLSRSRSTRRRGGTCSASAPGSWQGGNS